MFHSKCRTPSTLLLEGERRSYLGGIPIVIISSRTADKHRNQAAQLGVNAFLGKPYQESELLQHIATFIGAVAPGTRLH